jgi:hypothetical protein
MRGWHVLRQRWFAKGALADYGLILMGVWLLTQLNPAVPLFGIVFAPQGIPQPFVSPIANARLFLQLLEAGGIMLNVTAVGLIGATLLARRDHAAKAMAVMVLVMALCKAVMAGTLLKTDAFLAWLNWNVIVGGLAAWFGLAALAPLKRRWRAVAGLLCLVLARWVEYAWPLNDEPVSLFSLFKWRYGHLRDFGGLSQTLSIIWPWLAGVYLLLLIARDWRRLRHSVVID